MYRVRLKVKSGFRTHMNGEVTTHRTLASLWNSRGRLLKGRATSKKNPYGLSQYCCRAATSVQIVLKILMSFYDPKVDEEHQKPTVVWATSIVVGSMVASLMQRIRESPAPTEKESVFSLSLKTFGDKGPITCHPYARKYDIVLATFTTHECHPTADSQYGLKQSCFMVNNPADSDSVSSSATLHDSRLFPVNTTTGDVFRMQVASSSPHHIKLQVPQDIGFIIQPSTEKNVIVLHMDVLGFVDSCTDKFRPRPRTGC